MTDSDGNTASDDMRAPVSRQWMRPVARGILCALALTFAALFIASLCNCNLFLRAAAAIATDCSAELVQEVAVLLGQDDWKSALDAKSKSAGVDAVDCAVRAFLKSATPQTRTALLCMPLDMLRADRAELWLWRHSAIKYEVDAQRMRGEK